MSTIRKTYSDFWLCHIAAFFVLGFLIFFQSATAQTQCGLPFITSYSSKEYLGSTDNWAITQDQRGVMYFGNSNGVLEYDGVNWRMIPMLIEGIVRSLDVDSAGKVYVGGVGDFGYLEPDHRGSMRFVSLASKLKSEDREFGDVAKVYCSSKGVYFSTFKKIFFYSNGSLKTILPENQFHFSFLINDRLYVMDRGIGLKVVSNGSLKFVDGSSFLAEDRVYGMDLYDHHKILLSSRENGLYLFDPFKNDSTEAFTRFNSSADDLLAESQVYHLTRVNDTTFAFATLRGGVVLLGRSGKYFSVLNKRNALKDDNIKYVFLDRQKSLWMAMDNGIARAEVNSPLKWFTDVSGLRGSVQDIIRFNNRLYVSGTAGLFFSGDKEEACFTAYPGISSQARDLLVWRSQGGDKLLTATGQGVFDVSGAEPRLIGEYNAFRVYQSVSFPKRVFIGTNAGLAALRFENGKWIDEGMLEGVEMEISSIGEEKDGTIFVTNKALGIQKIEPDPTRRIGDPWGAAPSITDIDSAHGLPSKIYNYIFEYQDGLLFSTIKGLFRYDHSSGRLIKDNTFKGLVVDGPREIFCFVPENKDKVWMFTVDENIKETGIAIRNADGTYEWFSKPFEHFSESEIHAIFPDEEVVWLGGPDGLMAYNKRSYKAVSADFYPLIRKVTVGKDSLYFMGGAKGEEKNGELILANETVDGVPSFKYSLNTVAFEFSAPVFDNEKKNVYRWYLEGYDKGWSGWSKESRTQYTNLPEGSYKLHVQSRDIYKNTSRITTFNFEVLPPWYRTIYAYIVYFLLLLALIYVAVQISVRRLKQAKIQLENIVQERTAEVVRQKEEVEKQKLIVDLKNKDITDSINYASRIQQAILPVVDELRPVLPDLFVLFRPRDIVSGDFYWFYRKGNEVLMAAADCTGHGVPGAFMSMIGHTILNDVVSELEAPHPDLILNQLNIRIRSALKQDQTNESRDGMDIALCRLNTETLELEYAAAMRPLYLVRNDQLEEIKADKFPIGGLQEGTEKKFNRHTFTLSKGDGFYMSSDGYADQFGGPDGKKFMTKKFKELLQGIFGKPVHQQQELLLQSFISWKGEVEQVDDILVIGVRV